MTSTIAHQIQPSPRPSAYRFGNSWKRLASTLACIELNTSKEQDTPTLHANIARAYERHVDLILAGDNSINYSIDEANTFVLCPAGILTRDYLLDGMEDGKVIQRMYKDLKTVINNHLTPRYQKLLNTDGSIPSGKQTLRNLQELL
jgi:hypothetical protein